MNYFKTLLILSVLLLSLGGCLSNKTVVKTEPTPTVVETEKPMVVETTKAPVESTKAPMVVETKKAPAISYDFLAGLTKAKFGSDAFLQEKVEGDAIPMYLESGERIQGEKMKTMLRNTEFITVAYLNEENQTKAFLLKKATPKEISMREMMLKMLLKTKESKEGLAKKVDKDATPFYVQDLSGVEYSLENLKNKVVVLNFWFIACKPCVKEIPELNQLVEKYSDKEVVFIAFAYNKKENLENFLSKNNFKYNIIAESSQVDEDYGIQSYPTHIVIDKSSIIKLALTGGGTETIEQVDRAIERLLQE